MSKTAVSSRFLIVFIVCIAATGVFSIGFIAGKYESMAEDNPSPRYNQISLNAQSHGDALDHPDTVASTKAAISDIRESSAHDHTPGPIYRTRSTTSASTTAPGSIASVSAWGIIGKTKSDVRRYWTLSAANDTVGQNDLIRRGRVRELEEKDVFRIIQMNPINPRNDHVDIWFEVRIIDGDLAGQSGWVQSSLSFLETYLPHADDID